MIEQTSAGRRVTISYRSPSRSRGKARKVVCTITLPRRVHPAEVDLVDALLARAEAHAGESLLET